MSYSIIQEEIKDRVLSGRIEPDTWVNMKALSRELAVGLTPIREALFGLAAEGWVQAAPGRGFLAPALDAREVRGIYPMVWMLETGALREAPPRAIDLPALWRMNAELAAVEEPWKALEHDNAWHGKLVARYDNPVLHAALQDLKKRVARYEFAYMKTSGQVSKSTAQHEGIIRALEQGDLDLAVEQLRANWEIGQSYLLAWLDAGGTEPRQRR